MANIVYGDDPSCGIKKRVIHASKRELPDYPDGTRVISYYYVFKMCYSVRFKLLKLILLSTIFLFLFCFNTALTCTLTSFVTNSYGHKLSCRSRMVVDALCRSRKFETYS